MAAVRPLATCCLAPRSGARRSHAPTRSQKATPIMRGSKGIARDTAALAGSEGGTLAASPQQHVSKVMEMTSIRLRILAQTLPFLLIAPAVALAQTPPSRAEANTALHASANPSGTHFTRQQLDQVLAPIALYPDELLSNVLMAATYPQQILDANQWLQDPQHKDLKGDALAAALEPPPWDPSVKALMPFPQIIAMMADHIEWAQALGTAFAEDQAQVMARIQELRHLAMKSGKLKTVRHLNVREEGGEVVITSAEPDRIYVPIYNPRVIYGEAWPDRDYLPVYLPPPPGFVAETIEPGIEISSGYTVVRPLWGWSHPDWREHRITIERDRYTRITRNAELPTGNVWRHEGPVVAVTNAPRTTTTTTQVPAGTVAPASVARQGQAAQNGNQAPANAASAPANANQPAAQTNKPSSTATGQPQPAQPGQAAGAASQPGQNAAGTAKPGETSTGTNKPAQPATGANTPTDKGKANQAEQKAAPTAHPAEPAK